MIGGAKLAFVDGVCRRSFAPGESALSMRLLVRSRIYRTDCVAHLAVAESDLFVGPHLIRTVPHHLGDDDRRSIPVQCSNTGIAVRIGSHRKMEISRTGEQDAEVGSLHCVGRRADE